MEDIVKALMNVWTAFSGIGYDLWPTMFAVAVWVIARERWVVVLSKRPGLDKQEALALHARYKARIVWVTYGLSSLTAFAFKRSLDPFDIILSLAWGVFHTGMASLLYSWIAGKPWFKRLGVLAQAKGDRNA